MVVLEYFAEGLQIKAQVLTNLLAPRWVVLLEMGMGRLWFLFRLFIFGCGGPLRLGEVRQFVGFFEIVEFGEGLSADPFFFILFLFSQRRVAQGVIGVAALPGDQSHSKSSSDKIITIFTRMRDYSSYLCYPFAFFAIFIKTVVIQSLPLLHYI